MHRRRSRRSARSGRCRHRSAARKDAFREARADNNGCREPALTVAGPAYSGRVAYELAQVNVARLDAPLEHPRLRDFVAALDAVNQEADDAPGFLWRLQAEDGNATSIRAFEWDVQGAAGMIVNLSVWQSVDTLANYVFSGQHLAVMKRRREWFVPMREAYTALWWVPAGHRPTTDEAEQRVRLLREQGATSTSFTLRRSWPPPDQDADASVSRDDRMCPA